MPTREYFHHSSCVLKNYYTPYIMQCTLGPQWTSENSFVEESFPLWGFIYSTEVPRPGQVAVWKLYCNHSDKCNSGIIEAAHPWWTSVHTNTQTQWLGSEVTATPHFRLCTIFAVFDPHTHVHTNCSCILFKHTCSWTSNLGRVIPPAWGNSTGVGPQKPLGYLEVQAVLFSARDPPLESWSSKHTHDTYADSRTPSV